LVNRWSLGFVLAVVVVGISLGSTGAAFAQTEACTFFYPTVAFFYNRQYYPQLELVAAAAPQASYQSLATVSTNM
jgi:hypothetical protein